MSSTGSVSLENPNTASCHCLLGMPQTGFQKARNSDLQLSAHLVPQGNVFVVQPDSQQALFVCILLLCQDGPLLPPSALSALPLGNCKANKGEQSQLSLLSTDVPKNSSGISKDAFSSSTRHITCFYVKSIFYFVPKHNHRAASCWAHRETNVALMEEPEGGHSKDPLPSMAQEQDGVSVSITRLFQLSPCRDLLGLVQPPMSSEKRQSS